MRPLLLLAAGLVVVAGCGSSSTRQQLARQAMDEFEGLSCGTEGQVRQLAENAFEVRGCGQLVEYTDTRAGNARRWERMRPAASLASEALHCPLDALMPAGTQSVDARTFEGCGMRITYVLSCAEDGGCLWEPGDTPRVGASWGSR